MAQLPLWHKISVALLSVVLAACGGGGGSPTTPDEVPAANAGPNQNTVGNETVSLEGSATGGQGTISYRWTQTAGPAVTLAPNAATATPSFVAADVAGTLTFSLVVTDADGDASAADTVNITVAKDTAPSANAGVDQSVLGGATVALSGNASGGNGNVSYAWSQTAGTPVTLSPNAAVRAPSFVAPNGNGVLRFSLIATDADGDSSAADAVAITVTANTAPVANAGPDQMVAPAATVTLNGSASGGNGALTYAWTQTGGTAVTLSPSSMSEDPSFVAPSGNQTLTFSLVATDAGGSSSAADTVNITVVTDLAPVANAGPNQTVSGGVSVQLTGAGSSAGDGALSYQWVQLSGAPVSISGAATVNPNFTAPNTAGTLTFRLTVSDADGDEDSDTVSVSVTVAPSSLSADAGADASHNEGTTPTLNGAGSSISGGTIVRHQWRQVSGTSVALQNATMVTASFAAPNVAGPAANSVLVFELEVEDNQGNTDTDQVTVTINNSHVMHSGTLRFEDVPFSSTAGAGLNYAARSFRAARGITAQMASSAATVDETATSNSGRFSLVAPVNQVNHRLVFLAELKSATGSAAGWNVLVEDNTSSDALYAVSFTLGNTGNTDTDAGNIDIGSGWSDAAADYSGTRFAGPFAILDVVYDAIKKMQAADAGVQLPALKVNWSVNNRTCGGDVATGCISTSHFNPNSQELFILGAKDSDTDEYDSHIVVHEWGHYFESVVSRSDSIGGAHGGGDSLDMRLAMGEGFGNALSGIVTDDPRYRDSFDSKQSRDFVVNVELNNPAGWFNESTVQSVLYDLYDGTADAAEDVLQLGWGPLYDVFTSAAYVQHDALSSIFSFLEQLKANNSAAASQITSLAAARGIHGSDGYGVGETNAAGVSPSSGVLPVYTTLTVGAARTVCTLDDFGVPNKLSNRRFYRFDAPSSGSFQITATIDTAGRDPDLQVRHKGQLVANLEVVGNENRAVTLIAGRTYVFEAYDWELVGNGATGADPCITVQVTQN